MLEKKKKAIKICDRILAILVMWIWVNQNQRGFIEEAKGIGKKNENCFIDNDIMDFL